MIPFSSLPVLAAVTAVLATVVAAWRRRSPRETLRQAGAALGVAALGVGLAVVAYRLGRSPEAAGWRNAGAGLLVATPIVCAAVLRARYRLPWLRAAVAGLLVTALLLVWLLLGLRGPGGGWDAGRLLLAAISAAVAFAAAVCGAAWTRRLAPAVLLAVLALLGTACAGGEAPAAEAGVLVVEVRDGDTGEPIPARVEIADAAGGTHVPEDALPVAGDCGILPLHNWLPAAAPFQVRARRQGAIWNPFRERRQFYADARVETRLAPGRYELRATHGPEYRVATARVGVETGGVRRVTLAPERWIDLPAAGWYGADDHLHVPRPDPSFDPVLATWMAAEDLHVANLLQMGLARDVHVTPQHGFGAAGAHRRGTTLLVSGQENPRTHVLGHAITLGAPRWIDLPGDYLLYPRFWRRAHRHGAVNGLAHFGLAGAEKALALWADSGLLDFLEVENFGFPVYDRWYEVLNLGLPMTPTAGTDYPCVPNLPGRDRFYARVDGPFTLDGWLDAVRAGRTFVTNGPAVHLTVDGRGPGSELHLPAAGTVHVRGRVRFDPERDRVRRLELVERGRVVHAVEAGGGGGEIALDLRWPVERTTWLALRAAGVKPGEVRPPGVEVLRGALAYPPPRPGSEPEPPPVLPGSRDAPVSAAHTAAVTVRVAGTPPLFAQPPARAAADAWLSRLADLEHWLSADAPPQVTAFPGRGDGVPPELLHANRRALLAAIAESRAWLAAAGRGAAAASGPDRE